MVGVCWMNVPKLWISEVLSLHYRVSRAFRTNLLPMFARFLSVDVEAKLAVNPKVNTKRWENELQTLNVVCGSIGWRWSNRHRQSSSTHVNPQFISHVIDVCSADLQPFCDRQRVAWNVKQWVLHLPAFVDTGWVRKTGNHHHLIGQCFVNAVASQVSRAHLGRLSRDQAEVFDAFMSQRPRRKWYLIAICHVILRVLACLK